MDLEFLMNINEQPAWRILKREILVNEFPLYRHESLPLSSHDLVYALVDKDGNPITYKVNSDDTESFLVFTRPELVTRIQASYRKEEIQGGVAPSRGLSLEQTEFDLKVIMLGELVRALSTRGQETSLKINPVLLDMGRGTVPLLYCEDVIFAPQYDEFTGKLLLSDPEDAKALLAINPEDQQRFGIELVFYMITTRDLPDDREERDLVLQDCIEKLSFMAPRVPMKMGSGSFLAVLLNLENELEEQAFIRDYPMFDAHSDIIFVTSSLKLLTGRLEEVHYNGAKIDTIFGPLIKWQQNKSRVRLTNL